MELGDFETAMDESMALVDEKFKELENVENPTQEQMDELTGLMMGAAAYIFADTDFSKIQIIPRDDPATLEADRVDIVENMPYND